MCVIDCTVLTEIRSYTHCYWHVVCSLSSSICVWARQRPWFLMSTVSLAYCYYFYKCICCKFHFYLLFTLNQFHSKRIGNASECINKSSPQLTLMILLLAARIVKDTWPFTIPAQWYECFFFFIQRSRLNCVTWFQVFRKEWYRMNRTRTNKWSSSKM